MKTQNWSSKEEAALNTRGLHFETASAADKSIKIRHPKGWVVDFQDDHVGCLHGDPAQGFLTIFPIPGAFDMGKESLLVAFLDQFVAPGVSKLNIKQLGQLPGDEGLVGAQFSLEMANIAYEGVALVFIDRGLPIIAAYWVESRLFRKTLVTSLLKVVLGNIEIAPGSVFAPASPKEVQPIFPEDLWRDDPPPEGEAIADRQARFALRLPTALSVTAPPEGGKDRLWIFTPKETNPRDPALESLIFLTGEDLLGSLESTLHYATDHLDPEGKLRMEMPPLFFEDENQQTLIRVFVEHPDKPGAPIRRLVSAGFSNGESIVHIVAIAEADRIKEILPALVDLLHTVRVLPRPINQDHMNAFAGSWHFQEREQGRGPALSTEFRFHLNADRSFALDVEEVSVTSSIMAAPEGSLSGSPLALQSLTPKAEMGSGLLDGSTPDGWIEAAKGSEPSAVAAPEETGVRSLSGTWYIVDDCITFCYEDGGVQIRTIDTISDQMAILDGVFWKRLGVESASNP